MAELVEVTRCKDCPAFVKVDRSNCKKYFRGALDLINRLRAENEKNENIIRLADKTIETANARIEELVGNNDKLNIELQAMRGAANSYKAENERLKENLNVELENFASEYDNKIKAEAYKEFAEKLKKHARKMSSSDFGGEFWDKAVLVSEIDNLLKEMVGEEK